MQLHASARDQRVRTVLPAAVELSEMVTPGHDEVKSSWKWRMSWNCETVTLVRNEPPTTPRSPNHRPFTHPTYAPRATRPTWEMCRALAHRPVRPRWVFLPACALARRPRLGTARRTRSRSCNHTARSCHAWQHEQRRRASAAAAASAPRSVCWYHFASV